MTENIPLNAAATEQRMIEDLTGLTPQVRRHHEPDAHEAGDPLEPDGPADETPLGGRVAADDGA